MVYLKLQGITDSFFSFYAIAGVLSLIVASLILLAWSQTHNGVDLVITRNDD